MTFTFELENRDGEPADPPMLKTAVLNSSPGHEIPARKRTLTGSRRAPGDPDLMPVLVVEEVRTRPTGNRG
jgi:hypothetical protein